MRKKYVCIVLIIMILIIVFFFRPNYIELDKELTGVDILLVESVNTFENTNYNIAKDDSRFSSTGLFIEIDDERYEYVKGILEGQKVYRRIKGVFSKSGDEKNSGKPD